MPKITIIRGNKDSGMTLSSLYLTMKIMELLDKKILSNYKLNPNYITFTPEEFIKDANTKNNH